MTTMQRELIFTSFGRSGHHAIIFWILNNLGGYTEHDKDFIFTNEQLKLYYYNGVSNPMRAKLFTFPVTYNFLFKSKEDTLIIEEHEISVIRDFLNMTCSRYEYGFGLWGVLGNHSHLKTLDDYISAWKLHARRFLAKQEKCISYNHWLQSLDYRNTVCKNLFIENKIDNTSYVPVMGNGSSFIGRFKEADYKKYLTRYNQVKLPSYLKEAILGDEELLILNKDIFDIDIKNILI